MSEVELKQKLLEKIQARRTHITVYVNELESRETRLTTVSIVASAIAAALTAGPALGGTNFTEGVQHLLGLLDDSPVWRLLCLATTLVSILAAVLTNIVKSRNTAVRLAKAEAAGRMLAVLEAGVEFGQFSVDHATQLYQQYVAEIAFISEG